MRERIMRFFVFTAVFILAFGNLQINAQQTAQPSKENEETNKKNQQIREEYEKKLAEVQEKNRKITETNEKINQALSEGVQAFANKDYKLAIEKFDEGFILDPDFWGTAPVLLNNKAIALRMIGAEKYNNALRADLNPAFEANQYFLDAVSALKDAKKILDEAEIPNDEPSKSLFEKNRYISVKELAECYRLLVLTDKTRIYEAIAAFESYIKIETDEILKQKVRKDLKTLKSKFKITY